MIWRGAIAAAALLAAAPAIATQPDLRAQLEHLQALDAKVQSAGWRLVRGNAPYCHKVAPGVGLVLFDAAGFSDPKAVRDALDLPGDIAVEAVASDAPSARAGLRSAQPLSVVAGEDVTSLPAAAPGDYARLVGLHDRVDAALLATGKVGLVDAGGASISIAGEPVCVSRFELLSSGTRAAADGRRVVIGRALVEAMPQDDLLAAALAHELAHNLLGHRARLTASGRSWGKVKATEREADRLSVWLLANAGYDPAAAVRFYRWWGPKFDLGIFATPDHDGWKARVRTVSAEIETMRTAQAARGGRADWANDFSGAG
ncbi:M48 family metalloprotease [Novosphingobium sp. Gsoil 351]|uniref:M48 family metalloprotease n=1 Tax=Novosphingobium sp. Gsoil 351 TaxID=2675225 RepID=UPI0012B4CC46|nr:M48 family metalloprotease [Novosphingobium sp. Gsoil 351]QGN55117.1 hypothetical protein GKE62_11695 [Novosphingobium sp. Gsoil 351]